MPNTNHKKYGNKPNGNKFFKKVVMRYSISSIPQHNIFTVGYSNNQIHYEF